MRTREEQTNLERNAANLFSPRTPIATQEFFAGRYSQILKVVAAISQPGAHAIIYGERGVGKTSLANVAPFMLHVQESIPREKIVPTRINCDGTDSYDALWKKVFDNMKMSTERISMGFVSNREAECHSLLLTTAFLKEVLIYRGGVLCVE